LESQRSRDKKNIEQADVRPGLVAGSDQSQNEILVTSDGPNVVTAALAADSISRMLRYVPGLRAGDIKQDTQQDIQARQSDKDKTVNAGRTQKTAKNDTVRTPR
jgi:hypothetical protein